MKHFFLVSASIRVEERWAGLTESAWCLLCPGHFQSVVVYETWGLWHESTSRQLAQWRQISLLLAMTTSDNVSALPLLSCDSAILYLDTLEHWPQTCKQAPKDINLTNCGRRRNAWQRQVGLVLKIVKQHGPTTSDLVQGARCDRLLVRTDTVVRRLCDCWHHCINMDDLMRLVTLSP